MPGVRQALFQNACPHAVAAAVHRLAEFSGEARDQPRSLYALSSFHEAVRATDSAQRIGSAREDFPVSIIRLAAWTND
jgi:hypothetical protein